MKYLLSSSDLTFKKQVEACEFPVPDFNHRSHLRLAYIYLTKESTEIAVANMRNALMGLLNHAEIDPAEKYNETITEAWLLAVHHFMNKTEYSTSAEDFIEQNPVMLDPKIMMTHYSEDLLFSDRARQSFVEPNLDPIPRYLD